MCCNETVAMPCFVAGGVDCAAAPPGVGTLDDYDHLVVSNRKFFNATLAAVARRLAGGWPAPDATPDERVDYLETTYASSLYWDRDARFVVADFSSLFGDDDYGARLRNWTSSFGAPLLWAGGAFATDRDATKHLSAPFDLRLLDPFALATLNASAAVRGAAGAFDAAWAAARALRAANGTRAAWRALYAGLRAAAPDADVVPLVAGACADVEACVGATRRDGACVCRS